MAQFYSDLTLLDEAGREQLRKTISVNDPFRCGRAPAAACLLPAALCPLPAARTTPRARCHLTTVPARPPAEPAPHHGGPPPPPPPGRYGGVTMYQTDWSLAAVTLRVDNPGAALQAQPGQPFNLPLASLEGKPGVAGRLWATFLPIAPPQEGQPPRGISIVARDLQSVIFYDANGQFVGVRRPGSGKPIEVEGLQLVVDGVVGSTGLEIKADPGVPWVYAGFAGLMITTLVSYISHSQVWALQQGGGVYVAGKSNRAKVAFEKELGEVLDDVPEAAPAMQVAQAVAAGGGGGSSGGSSDSS